MSISIGSIWVGTQSSHKWIVRIRKVMPKHVLVEVLAGPSGHRKTFKKFRTAHFVIAYAPRFARIGSEVAR